MGFLILDELSWPKFLWQDRDEDHCESVAQMDFHSFVLCPRRNGWKQIRVVYLAMKNNLYTGARSPATPILHDSGFGSMVLRSRWPFL